MTFGENLRALRTSRSISQKELAEELGFSFQNISKWERNDSLPDIGTLLAVAKFFGTTTDALLGHLPEEKFSTLRLDENEVKLYKAYPAEEETVTGKIIVVVDGEGKIAATVSGKWGHRTGYLRGNYAQFDDEASTVVYDFSYQGRRGMVADNRRIKIPADGFLIIASNAAFATKKLLRFVLPEEYYGWLNPDAYPDYYNHRNGKYLFSDILKHNELDHITVELIEGGVLFKKPADAVDPMAVNIEALAKIVRRELEKEHNRQMEDLKNKIEELSDMVEDNEGRIDELEGRIDELESQMKELSDISEGKEE